MYGNSGQVANALNAFSDVLQFGLIALVIVWIGIGVLRIVRENRRQRLSLGKGRTIHR